jgi:BolA protein
MSRKERIELALRVLQPSHLEVVDESHMHSVPEGAESHFKVVVVAPGFEGVSLVARHRRVNELVASELRAGLHALSIHAFSPAQWAERAADPESPACRGGAGK